MFKFKFFYFLCKLSKFNYSDINYAWSDEQLNRVSNANLFVPKSRQGVLIRLCLFLLKAFVSFLKEFNIGNKNRVKFNGDILVYYGSLNQRKALEQLLGRSDVDSMSELNDGDIKFPLFLVYVYSILLSPLFIKYLFKNKSTYLFSSLKFNIDGYLITIGYFVVWFNFLKKKKYDFVIMANDHNPSNRALNLACKELNIKTIYIQHAPAVLGFPKLDYSYAFLEGLHAYNVYNKEKSCKIELVGSPITDGLNLSLNEVANISIIGVSTGLISNLGDIEEFVKLLTNDYDIILRPHPADYRYELWKGLAEKYNLDFSSPKIEPPKFFLEKISLLVGPMSGLLLEAAINKKIPFCFNGKSDVPDWYSLISNRVCINVSSAKQMQLFLENNNEQEIRAEVFKAANYYYFYESGTTYFERIDLLISKLKAER